MVGVSSLKRAKACIDLGCRGYRVMYREWLRSETQSIPSSLAENLGEIAQDANRKQHHQSWPPEEKKRKD
jgi:hypothetical protein